MYCKIIELSSRFHCYLPACKHRSHSPGLWHNHLDIWGRSFLLWCVGMELCREFGGEEDLSVELWLLEMKREKFLQEEPIGLHFSDFVDLDFLSSDSTRLPSCQLDSTLDPRRLDLRLNHLLTWTRPPVTQLDYNTGYTYRPLWKPAIADQGIPLNYIEGNKRINDECSCFNIFSGYARQSTCP